MNRKKILQDVGVMISDDRNKTHGDPLAQLRLATELKSLAKLNDIATHNKLTCVEIEALSSIITKISRIIVGVPIMDHWQDIAGYAAIACESRSKQDQ